MEVKQRELLYRLMIRFVYLLRYLISYLPCDCYKYCRQLIFGVQVEIISVKLSYMSVFDVTEQSFTVCTICSVTHFVYLVQMVKTTCDCHMEIKENSLIQ